MSIKEFEVSQFQRKSVMIYPKTFSNNHLTLTLQFYLNGKIEVIAVEKDSERKDVIYSGESRRTAIERYNECLEMDLPLNTYLAILNIRLLRDVTENSSMTDWRTSP